MGVWSVVCVAVTIPYLARAADIPEREKGYRVGFLHVLPRLTARAMHESNVFRTQSDAVGDFGTAEEAGLGMNYRRTWVGLQTVGEYRREQFYGLLSTEAENRKLDAWRGRGEVSVDAPNGIAVNGVYEYLNTEEAVDSEFVLARTEIQRIRHLASADLRQRFGQGLVDTQFRYSYLNEAYPTAGFETLDYGEHAIQAHGDIRTFPKTAMFVRTGAKLRGYVRGLSAERDSFSFSADAGTVAKWSTALSFTLDVGASAYRFASGYLKVLPLIELEAAYSVSPRSEFMVNYKHAIQDATNALFVITDLIRTRVKRQWTRSWSSQVLFSWWANGFGPADVVDPTLPGMDRTDYTVNLNAGLTYAPVGMPSLDTTLGYVYESRFSDFERYRFANHVVAYEVSWRP